MTVTLAQPSFPYRPQRLAEPVARRGTDFEELTSTVAAERLPATRFSLGLNDVQLRIRAWVHDFADGVIRPAADRYEESGPPWPIIEEAARVGLYSPEFVTNAVGDPAGLILPVVAEEVAWGDFRTGLVIVGTAVAAAEIVASGTAQQVAEWLPVCFEGDNGKVNLAAFGVSEPEVDPHARSLWSRAVYDQARDEWTLNGIKTFVTNGGIADVHVLVLSVDPGLGAHGQASFIVPPGTAGLVIGQKLTNKDICVPHTVELILDDVRVPGHCLLGGRERLDERLARARGAMSVGRSAMTVFETFHPVIGAQAVGVARGAYDYALDHAKEYERYGQPLFDDEVIALELADMKATTDAARLLVWRAAWMASTGQPLDGAEGLMSRLYAGENAVWVIDQAIQIADQAGYMPDYPLRRWQRDATFFTNFDGRPNSRTTARASSSKRLSRSPNVRKNAGTD